MVRHRVFVRAGEIVAALVVVVIAAVLLASLAACSGGATSHITPAESKAHQEQIDFRGATSETTTVEIIIGDSAEVK